MGSEQCLGAMQRPQLGLLSGLGRKVWSWRQDLSKSHMGGTALNSWQPDWLLVVSCLAENILCRCVTALVFDSVPEEGHPGDQA